MRSNSHWDWSTRAPRVLAILLVLFIAAAGAAWAQSAVTLSISKSSDAPSPSVPSGQAFTYTLSYSWSGGAPGTITIIDTVPSNLTVISTLPSATVSGNIVTFTLTGISASAGAGTVQINVKFPPGVTCNGARACNTAWISAQNIEPKKTTQTVCAVASATNKWTMEKSLIAGCAVNDAVIYRICIMNPSGGDIGGLNLTNVQVQDLVPAGSIVDSVWGSWNSGVQVGTTVTLGGGPTTLPVNQYNVWYCAYIRARYPSAGGFTVGQTLVDTARVTYKTPCDTQKVGMYVDTAKVTLCAANPSGQLSKWLSINMYFPSNPWYYPSFSPGCCGTYTLWYTNTGNVSQPGFVMEDNVPSTLDVTSIQTNVTATNLPVTLTVYCWTGTSCGTTPCTTFTYNTVGLHTMTGLPANVCKVRWTYSGSISPTQFVYNYLNVCVRPASYAPPFTPVAFGQNILNTVTAQATNLPMISANHNKPVDSLRPHILATKNFMGSGCSPGCSPNTTGPFVPGQIVRWRMSVANVGNMNANTCTITDLLPSGLSYVGNPTYHYGPSSWTASTWTPPCCSLTTTVPSQVGGTMTTPSVGDTNLTWTFPTLPFRCDGVVEYLTIEFDVLIGTNPPMPPGQYFNKFTFSAANLTTPVTSNNAQLTVNAIAQLTLLKEVRPKTTGGTFSSTASIAPGAMAEFRLRLKNTGNLTLTNICLFDVMPHVGDISVIGTTPTYPTRNSQFDMPVTGAANVTVPAGYTVGFNGSSNTKNPTRTSICGGFCGGIVNPVNGVPSLTPGAFGPFSSPTYSFTVNGGSTPLPPGGTLDIFVSAQVPAGAKPGERACNSFAVQAKPLATTQCLQTEAVPACISVAEKPPTTGCDRFWLEGHTDDCCRYTFTMSNANGAAVQSLQYNVLPIAPSTTPSGTVQNITTSPCLPTSTVPGSLGGTTTGILNFNPTCTGASPTTVNISAASNLASGEVCIELIARIQTANGQTVICRDTVCFRCDRPALTRCDSMSVKPFPFNDLDLSGRTFTVYNLKSPASPICSVKIVVTPPPSGPGVNGGGLYVDGVWKSWPFGSSVGYTEIKSVHGLPANNTVQFNLGIDYTIGWVGNVSVTSYHCDGDSCEMKYGPWVASKKDIILVGTPVDVAERDSLRVGRVSIDRKKGASLDIKHVKLSFTSGVGRIVAATPASAPCDGARDCDDGADRFESVSVNGRSIMVTLEKASVKSDRVSVPITVLYTATGNRRPTMELIYFDSKSQEVGRDTVTVNGLALPDPPGGADHDGAMTGRLGALRAMPNPTTGLVELGFSVPRVSTVDLELTDALGRTIAKLVSGELLHVGEHMRTYDMTELPNGSYMAVLRIDGVPTAMRLELMR